MHIQHTDQLNALFLELDRAAQQLPQLGPDGIQQRCAELALKLDILALDPSEQLVALRRLNLLQAAALDSIAKKYMPLGNAMQVEGNMGSGLLEIGSLENYLQNLGKRALSKMVLGCVATPVPILLENGARFNLYADGKLSVTTGPDNRERVVMASYAAELGLTPMLIDLALTDALMSSARIPELQVAEDGQRYDYALSWAKNAAKRADQMHISLADIAEQPWPTWAPPQVPLYSWGKGDQKFTISLGADKQLYLANRGKSEKLTPEQAAMYGLNPPNLDREISILYPSLLRYWEN